MEYDSQVDYDDLFGMDSPCASADDADGDSSTAVVHAPPAARPSARAFKRARARRHVVGGKPTHRSPGHGETVHPPVRGRGAQGNGPPAATTSSAVSASPHPDQTTRAVTLSVSRVRPGEEDPAPISDEKIDEAVLVPTGTNSKIVSGDAVAVHALRKASAAKRKRSRQRARKAAASGVSRAASDGNETVCSDGQTVLDTWSRRRGRGPDLRAEGKIRVNPSTFDSLARRTSGSVDVRIKPFKEMLAEFPHMGTSQSRPATVTTADGKVLSTTPQPRREEPNPPLTDLVRKQLKALFRPSFSVDGVNQLTPAGVSRLLQQKVARLPLLTAEYETMLLGEAGSWPVVLPGGEVKVLNFPACLCGEDCIGTIGHLAGFPRGRDRMVLMGLMYPDELRRFLDTKGEVAPSEARPCILCCRANTTEFSQSTRFNLLRVGRISRSFVCQLYRNLVNQSGGYSSNYVTTPSNTRYEGFVDPIANFKRDALLVYPDPNQGGRLCVDQTAMLYHPPRAEPPRVGEQLQHYRVREWSKAMYDYELLPEQRDALAKLHDPCAVLARSYLPDLPADIQTLVQTPYALRTPAQATRLVEWAQTVEAKAADYDPQLVRLCGFLYDESLSLRDPRRCPRDSPRARTYYAPWQVTQSFYAILQGSWWMEARNVRRDPMVHLLTKATPQKCQTRKLWKILKGVVGESARHALYMREWVLTSLLGQWEYVQPNNRLLPEQRDALRKIALHRPDILNEFIDQAFMVSMFALREQICYTIDCDPVFAANAAQLFQVAKFRRIVRTTMDKVRGYLRRQTTLLRSFADGSVHLLEPRQWAELNGMCKDVHDKVLEASYQRQRAPLMRVLHACLRYRSGRFDLRVLPPEPPESIAVRIGNRQAPEVQVAEHERVDTLNPRTGQWEEPKPLPAERTQGRSQLYRSLDEKQRSELKDRPYISHEVMDVLSHWIKHLHPLTPSLSNTLFPYLRFLGVPPEALEWMQLLELDYDRFRMGKRGRKKYLGTFQAPEQFPYSFYLMQVACMLWQQHSNTLLYVLPAHYRENQLQAFRERYNIPEAGVIPLEPTQLMFCTVCDQLYSDVVMLPRHPAMGFGEWQCPTARARPRRKSDELVDDDDEDDDDEDEAPVKRRKRKTAGAVDRDQPPATLKEYELFKARRESELKARNVQVLTGGAPDPLPVSRASPASLPPRMMTSNGSGGQHPLLLGSAPPRPTYLPPPDIVGNWVDAFITRTRLELTQGTLRDHYASLSGESAIQVPTFRLPPREVANIAERVSILAKKAASKRRKIGNRRSAALGDVVVDYLDGSLHCANDHKKGHVRCSTQPLKSLTMLGRLLLLNGRQILICPQEACGRLMVYDARLCATTDRGVACSKCTETLKQKRFDEHRLVPCFNGADPPRRCELCLDGGVLTEQRVCYLYGHGVVLCHSHHTHKLAEYMRKRVCLDKASTVAHIRYFLDETARRKQQLYGACQRRALQAQKQFSRTRRMAMYA